ncbi:MAG: hypothetical protein JXR53_10325 [Bacteroidales bacterium]|nr:hypothetical protein [Bacteroidales bacterium]
MKHLVFPLLILVFLFSCSNKSGQKDETTDTSKQDSVAGSKISPWADEYITRYIDANKDRFKKSDKSTTAYIKDTITINERSYTTAKIGDNSEERFVTEQWIYIDNQTCEIFEYDPVNDSLSLWLEHADYTNSTNEIPADGQYRFDIAFAEWRGESMGEKVTIVIKGDSIKVVYEGDGQICEKGKREILDEGVIMKHKSGDWIIGKDPSDVNLDEVGGCTDGPAVIDFKNKKFWMC